MQICKLYEKNLSQILDFIWKVFLECDLPDYEEMGVESFRYFIRYENIKKMMDDGELVFWVAYEGNQIIGVVAMRELHHISLLFVDPRLQQRGIGKRLVRCGINYCIAYNENLTYITVNSSPKGVKAYQKMGFEALTEEQIKEGMRFTPMRLFVGKEENYEKNSVK